MNSENKLKESEVRAFSKFTGRNERWMGHCKGRNCRYWMLSDNITSSGLLETSSLLSLYIPKVLPDSCKDVGQTEVGIEFLKRG